jgi:ribonuclease P/MRP protein subunit RPP40
VEVNLRLPSMLHGKKGFDRIVYAFKNVLSAPVTWLFCDLGSKGVDSSTISTRMTADRGQALTPDPLDIHFPTRRKIFPEIILNIKVNLPQLKPPTETITGYAENFEDFAVETHEWLSLISLGSPRINPDSHIDSFLCRYVSPGNPTISSKLVKITWQGFFSSSWAHKLFVQALSTVPREAWFAYYVGGFGESCLGGSKDCTILKEPEGINEYILWEVS